MSITLYQDPACGTSRSVRGLINRSVIVTPLSIKLCRPSKIVLKMPPPEQSQ